MAENKSAEKRSVNPEDCRCVGSVGPNPRCPVHGEALTSEQRLLWIGVGFFLGIAVAGIIILMRGAS